MQQLIVSGIATGSLYALMALGLVLVHKGMGVVNFAHGEVAMFSTFVAFWLMLTQGAPTLVAALAAMAFAALVSIVIQRALLRPVLDRPEAHAIIMTVGLFLIFNTGAGWIFGADPRGFDPILPMPSLRITSAAVVSGPQLLIIVTTAIVLALLATLFRATKLGLAMRATQQDARTASLMGVRIGYIYAVTWAIAGLLGAVTGVLTAPLTGLSPQMMVPMLVNGLAAAVIAGFDNLPGVVAGGLILGVGEALIGGYISLNLQVAATFAAIMVILVVRPHGLFSTARTRRV